MLFKIEKDNIKIKNKNLKTIVAEFENPKLEHLFFNWIRTLKNPFNKSQIAKQVTALKKFPDEIIELKIKKAILNGYGTFIYKEKKVKEIDWKKRLALWNRQGKILGGQNAVNKNPA